MNTTNSTHPAHPPGTDSIARIFTVCIVDDDPMWRRALRRTLESHGHRVVERGSASELFDQPIEANIVCLDLGLGDTSGLVVLERLRREAPHVSVVVTTGDTSLDTAVRAMKMGACDYVTKPMDTERLLAALDTAKALSREPEIVPLEKLERTAIERALRTTGGHVAKAAKLLGLGRATLYRRLTTYGLDKAITG